MAEGRLESSIDCKVWQSPKFYIFAIGLFFICITFGLYLNLPGFRKFGPGENEREYDLVIFSQRHAMSYCIIRGHCVLHNNARTWTIHGIWPTKEDEPYPQYCREVDFDINKLNPLINDLGEHWPSLYGQDILFWEHEWLKHGSCGLSSSTLNSQYKYFKTGLDWHKEFDIERVLENAGVYPSDSESHEFNDIWNIIEDAFGSGPAIICREDEKQGVHIITEIRLCFSRDVILAHCYRLNILSCCADIVYYPRTVSFDLQRYTARTNVSTDDLDWIPKEPSSNSSSQSQSEESEELITKFDPNVTEY